MASSTAARTTLCDSRRAIQANLRAITAVNQQIGDTAYDVRDVNREIKDSRQDVNSLGVKLNEGVLHLSDLAETSSENLRNTVRIGLRDYEQQFTKEMRILSIHSSNEQARRLKALVGLLALIMTARSHDIGQETRHPSTQSLQPTTYFTVRLHGNSPHRAVFKTLRSANR